ncbi:MAG TPA: ATP-binding protein [Anaeromyxobacteraceae bacterium]|nr:ATP-binding protein [Anaeromyxobacteraceae bacterium]
MRAPFPRWLPLAVFAVFAAGLGGAGVLLQRSMRAAARGRALAELDAVAALKVAAVEEWRGDHVRNAEYAGSYPSVLALAAAPSRDGGRAHDHVADVLMHFAERFGYSAAALVDRGGGVLADGLPGAGAGAPRALIERAVSSGRPASDLALDGAPRLEIAAPVPPEPGARAVLFVRVPAVEIVAGAMSAWPSSTATATAAIVRGGPGTPPAGAPALSAVRPISDSRFAVETRMAIHDVEAPLLHPAAAIALLVLALVIASGAALLEWWRRESERRRMEEALHESQERLQLALAGTHLVWDWDLGERRLHGEREWLEWVGVDRDALEGDVGAVLHRIVHPADLAQVRERLEAHLRGDTPIFEAEHRLPPPREDRWVRVRGRVSRRDGAGNPLRITGVVSDATEERRVQAQLATSERMAALGTLAAGVAHEINNPLAYLIANLDYASAELRPGADPAALGDALAEAREGAERVRRTVQALRAFARPSSGGRGPVDVSAELDAALRMARNEVRHHARLDVRIGPMPQVAAGDRELGQVFLNLLVNAAQAIPEGDAGRHLVQVVADTDPQGRARVEIHDSGAGIPADVLPRLFTPFFTTKAQGVGVGLGLAICHGIVQAAGGTIEVESQLGRGTTFRVLLPPVVPAASVAAGVPAAAGAVPAELAGRLLVVDDDPLVGRALARALRGAHEVVVATSAAEALDRIRGGERFDAVVCDLMMPEMTGMDLYERVGEIAPELAHRIVFATGGAFTERSRDFLQRVPNARIEKPFDPVRLREAVACAMAGAPARP